MTTNPTRVRRFSRGRKVSAPLTLSFAVLVISTPSFAQEKTLAERAKEYRDKIVASMEATAKAAGDEYSKLKSEASKAAGPAREKLATEMEALSKKWSEAREKLAGSLDTHTHSLGDDLKKLEEKAAKATGSAREQTTGEIEKLRGEWHVAREKLSAAFSTNMKAARDEFTHLKEQSGNTSADVKGRLAARMDALKAEWRANREKLAAHLDADLKRTKEEMDKLGAETSSAAKLARDTLAKKYQDLRAQSNELAREKSLDQ
jgi:hypothetical protein